MPYERPFLATIFYGLAAVGLIGCLFFVIFLAAAGSHSSEPSRAAMAIFAGIYGVFAASGAILSCLLLAAIGLALDLLARTAHDTRRLLDSLEAREARERPGVAPVPSSAVYRIPGL